VGRKSGARVRSLKAILADSGRVPAEAVHRVKIRERYSFIEVDREHAETAIEVLDGTLLGDHSIAASISSRSRADGS